MDLPSVDHSLPIQATLHWLPRLRGSIKDVSWIETRPVGNRRERERERERTVRRRIKQTEKERKESMRERETDKKRAREGERERK